MRDERQVDDLSIRQSIGVRNWQDGAPNKFWSSLGGESMMEL
jgi:hypothetical protein